jgi:hypothetical protein
MSFSISQLNLLSIAAIATVLCFPMCSFFLKVNVFLMRMSKKNTRKINKICVFCCLLSCRHLISIEKRMQVSKKNIEIFFLPDGS